MAHSRFQILEARLPSAMIFVIDEIPMRPPRTRWPGPADHVLAARLNPAGVQKFVVRLTAARTHGSVRPQPSEYRPHRLQILPVVRANVGHERLPLLVILSLNGFNVLRHCPITTSISDGS